MIFILVSFICGIIFGLGLIISGMTNPNNVINFLDITGNWDYALAFVMGSALLVFGLGYFLIIKKSEKPICDEEFYIPTNKIIDKQLIIGAVLFGIGWGLTGICPGPAVVNIFSNNVEILMFIVSMVTGMLVSKIINKIISK